MNWGRVWTLQNIERLLVGDLFTKGEMGGLLLTVTLGLSAIVLATLFGAILGLMRYSERRWLRYPSLCYTEIVRNVPVLILIFWIFFVPPYYGIELSKFTSVLIALTLFTTAYIAEVVRAGLQSIPREHIQAGRALGLGRIQLWVWILLPQAFFNMIPALTGRYIVAIKNTSLAFLIGLADLTEIGKQINTRLITAPIEVYMTLLLLYFFINYIISSIAHKMENRRRFNRFFIHL